MLFKNKFLLFFVISVGSVIGIVRGEEAKQKWVFRIKSKVIIRDSLLKNVSRRKKVVFYSMISKWHHTTTNEMPLKNIHPFR